MSRTALASSRRSRTPHARHQLDRLVRRLEQPLGQAKTLSLEPLSGRHPAAGPLENPLEDGMTREQVVESVFGSFPTQSVDRAFANVGTAIAAFETKIRLEPAHFDRYVSAARANDRHGMRAAMSAQGVEG